MKKQFRERMSEVLEMPKEVIMDLPKLTMAGDKELYLENYKSILEYTDKLVRLNLGRREIKISGTDLAIRAIESADITVSGTISAVEFL